MKSKVTKTKKQIIKNKRRRTKMNEKQLNKKFKEQNIQKHELEK